jgi:hypothetical protein
MNIVWLEPWTPIDRLKAGAAFRSELHAELSVLHPLFGLSAAAVARRGDQDDVLFELADGRVAEVHLTWSRKLEPDPRLPETMIFASLTVWAEERMKPLHEEAGPFDG